MLAGKDVWWSWVECGIEFYGGEDDPCRRQEGPGIHSFTSFNLHRESSFFGLSLGTYVDNFSEGLLKLPIKRIKVSRHDRSLRQHGDRTEPYLQTRGVLGIVESGNL